MPKTGRCADDLAFGEPTEAIIRDSITEPKRFGKNLVVEDKIVDKRVATSQILGVTSLGYNASCRIASWGAYVPSSMEPDRFVIT